jgi:DNA invertase Pin-like site-specific DNA recombinase
MDRHRPGLHELLRAVEGGEVTTVIVANLPSLLRSIAHLHEITERMRRYRCALISLEERCQPENAGVRA